MAPVTTGYVELAVRDGTAMRAFAAHPETPPRAGLLVFQEAFGVNAHIRELTERFAGEGYLAIAPELFHRTAAPGFEGSYEDFETIKPHFQSLTDEGLAADIRAAYDWLRADKPLAVGATGYCMGGRTSCLAALTVPLACAVSYYGGGIAKGPYFPALTDRLAEISAPLLFFWGGLDAHIGPEQIREVTEALRAAEKSFINVEISDADHGFFCDKRASYNVTAAAHAWALTTAFFNTYLGK